MPDATKALRPLDNSPASGGIAARAMAQARGNLPYLQDLNPEQRAAVEQLDGPVLVLAGAGTGKTRVLTTRIAHILNLGRARPGEILSVTFTNKAAREMKHRVGQMVGQAVEGMPWMGTFHSIGVKILRRHAELVGLKPDFTILGTDDQIRLIKQLFAAENLDEKRWPARVFAGVLDGWKNRGLAADQVPLGEAAAFANKGKKLYAAYQERLKVLNAADFGDLLLENIRLFREHPDVLRQYQGRFKYILVDEYQDTNVAQYLWLRLLAQSMPAATSAVVPSPPREDVDAGSASGEEEAANIAGESPSPQPAPLRGEGVRPTLPHGQTSQTQVSAPQPNPLPVNGEREHGGARSGNVASSSSAVIPGRTEGSNPESSGTGGFPSPLVGEGAEPRSGEAGEGNLLMSGIAPSPGSLRSPPSPTRGEGQKARTPLDGPRAPPPRAPKNICCVGDDDQSIYGWRGAEVDNILRFERDFPGATVIRLERNYRSTGHILAAASHLIAHNEGRLGKTLRTEDELGEKVHVTGAWDSEEEARSIGEEIEQLQRQGHILNEIAILVRASFQMREFEDRFVTLGLPYRVIGGPRFYERAEIRDALAYLRVINSPADDLAFERIVNVPKRGLGDATIQMLHDLARKRRIPMTEAARAMIATDEMKPKPRSSLRGVMECFDRWRAQKDTLPHTELAEIMLDESGYTEMWQKDRSADAAGRLENLKELIRSMEEFENLQGFLEHIALVMDTDKGEGVDAVSVMTLHAAKGLEFDTVFLPGWEEGLFPHQRALDEQGRAGLEEERRLGHVGLTRARKRAKLYFATNRRIHGLWSTTIPSRFLDELPEQHVEVTESQGGHGGYGGYGASRFDEMQSFGSSYTTPGWQRAQANRAKSGFGERGARYGEEASDVEAERGGGRKGAVRPGAGDRFNRNRAAMTIEGELVAKSTGTASDFTLGDRVFHQKFGNGNVTAIDGNKLTIAFDKAGEKRVVDSFVERV